MLTKEHYLLLEKYKKRYKPTKEETIFENLLKGMGIKYQRQRGFLAKCYTCFIADFYFPKPYRLIVEIDGPYHKNRIDKDRNRDLFFLMQRGIKTMRFTNEEINTQLDSVRNYLLEYLARK